MKPLTICFTYFRSLQLSNLDAALFSVKQQDLSDVEEIIILDNNTEDSFSSIKQVVDRHSLPNVVLLSTKHGDLTKTHSWSTNETIGEARTPWVFFTRADYILDFNIVKRFREVATAKEYEVQGMWNGFVTANVYHLNSDIGVCEQTPWRTDGTLVLRSLAGKEEDYTLIDTGVWMAKCKSFEAVGGLDESLFAWGHAQTHFQWKLHESGVEFVRIPEPLFFHPLHSAEREIAIAHKQLRERGGVNLHDMWASYRGPSPY